MKKKKILEMYYDLMENGIPGRNGLCNHLEKYEDWYLICPNDEELESLGQNGLCIVWWGSEQKSYTTNCRNQSKMTPLRQNIVLLMAAMAGEL